MEKTKAKQLGSSEIKDGIVNLIKEYFASLSIQLHVIDDGENHYYITNSKGRIDGYTVRFRKGRYIFMRHDKI